MFPTRVKSHYINRDLNQKLICFPKSFFLESIIFEFSSKENLYAKFAFLCLFLDEYPQVSLIKNSLDNKKVGNINGCRVILRSDQKKKLFLFRLKTDLYSLFPKRLLSDNGVLNSFSFNANPNSIKEFSSLYEQFYDLPDFRIALNFAGKQKKEALLNLSAWLK